MRRAVLIAAVLVVFVSCGSEDASSDRTPAPTDRPVASAPARAMSRAEFVSAVNAACRAYADRDEKIESPEQLSEYVPFMNLFIDNSADLDAELGALRPPPDVKDFDDYVAGNRKQTNILRAALGDLEAAVRAKDQAEADVVLDDAIDQFNAVVDELDPYARRYGLVDCTSEPDE